MSPRSNATHVMTYRGVSYAFRGANGNILLGHGAAVTALSGVPVHAATDISGFGLGGHAANIAESSSVTAVIAANRLPVYDLTRPLIEAGYTTSMSAENSRDLRVSYARDYDPVSLAALSDPQTAGPMLLAIPKDFSAEVIGSLRAAGYHSATCVGEVVERQASPVIVT